MLRWILSCIVLLYFSFSHAQDVEVPGYVVLNSGDTLKGTVILRGYLSAPDSVQFSGRHYTVADCKAFAAGPDVYKRWTVKMDLSYYDDIEHTIYNADSVLTTTVFLKQIHTTKNLELFKFHQFDWRRVLQPQKKKQHFYLLDKANETMTELLVKYRAPDKHKSEFRGTGGEMSVAGQTLNIYRDQLYAYFDFSNERKLKRKVDRLFYSEPTLIAIITEIDSKIK